MFHRQRGVAAYDFEFLTLIQAFDRQGFITRRELLADNSLQAEIADAGKQTERITSAPLGAQALFGAAAAWYVASATGRYRDRRETLHPLWDWGRSVSR